MGNDRRWGSKDCIIAGFIVRVGYGVAKVGDSLAWSWSKQEAWAIMRAGTEWNYWGWADFIRCDTQTN